jgi:hypothetical protein
MCYGKKSGEIRKSGAGGGQTILDEQIAYKLAWKKIGGASPTLQTYGVVIGE